MLGGTMYNEYNNKEDALEAAIKHSIGKEIGKDFVAIYRIQTTKFYDERQGFEMLVKTQTTETLAMLVSARTSANSIGGYVDYET
jgi:hypothetical protein